MQTRPRTQSRQIQKQAPQVTVERYGLSTDPQAFVVNTAVTELLKNKGPECLPLTFVDGTLLAEGFYLGNDKLTAILQGAGIEVTLDEQKRAACGCGPRCC